MTALVKLGFAVKRLDGAYLGGYMLKMYTLQILIFNVNRECISLLIDCFLSTRFLRFNCIKFNTL